MNFFLHANSEDIHMYMYLVYGVLQRTLIKKKIMTKRKKEISSWIFICFGHIYVLSFNNYRQVSLS